MIIKKRTTCRICGSRNLVDIMSLGEQYIVNFVDSKKDKSNKAPLDLVMCTISDGGCGLLQLKHTFDHDILYNKYWYRSSTSTTMIKALNEIVASATQIIDLKEGDIVVDIGANDGTLLLQYTNKDIIKVGYEPSNLWEYGNKQGLKIIHDYFNAVSFEKQFDEKKAKIITSIAMFYDLDDPNKFVADIKKCLDPNGIWIIQMNYLGTMLENNTFDNISHEHLEYYSFSTLEYLLNKYELEAFDIELNNVNGGSFRIYIKNKDSLVNSKEGKKHLKEIREYEAKKRLESKETYEEFAKRISNIKNKLVTILKEEKAKGKKIFIYGASTRGLVVLQYMGITNTLIEAAVDKNPDKWGKYIVGTNIPIISLEEYRKDKPDYLFVLPYHFLPEIMEQEKEFLNKGGKMIVAIPSVKVIK